MILYLLSLIRRCPGLPDDRHFVKLVGRQDKVILVLFYTNLQLLAKLVMDSILSQSNFWICGHSILKHSRKCSSGDGSPVEIGNLVVATKHNVSSTRSNLAFAAKPAAKLIGFNRKLRGELKNGDTDIEFAERKADPETMKMLLTLDGRMYKKKTRKTLQRLASMRTNKSKLMKFFLTPKVTQDLFNYYGIVPKDNKKD